MKNLKVNNEINEQLQPIKTDEVSSSLEVSKSKVKTQHLQVDGDLTVNGYIDGALRAESELNLESNGTINLISSTSSVSNDITLNTGGRDLTIQNDTEKIIAFSNGGGIVPTLLLYAWNGNTDDFLSVSAAGNDGQMTIQTTDAAGESADLKLDADGDLTLESETDIVKITCSNTEQARFTSTGLNIAQGQKIALDGTTTEDYIYGDGTDVFIALGDSDITTF